MCPQSSISGNRLPEENLRLKSAIEELSILNDIATAISSTQSLESVTNLIVKKCVRHLKAQQGAIQLFDEKSRDGQFHTMIRVKDSHFNKDELRFDAKLTAWMMENKKPLLLNEFKEQSDIQPEGNLHVSISSLLSVPMLAKGRMIGVISLYNKQSADGFSEADKRLLSIIAAQSANVIENTRLLEEEKTLFRIQQELSVASEIQRNLLPHQLPAVNGFDLYAINIPALEVGGDYYDLVRLSESRTAMALGDVSGKGLPAALLMANLQATLRSQLLFCNSPKECVRSANRLLFRSTDPSKFASLFFGILDSSDNTFRYCNAGHNIPVLIQDDEIVLLKEGGVLLGCIEDAVYDEGKVELSKGATLVVYSDGVTEALNSLFIEYGEKRLTRLVSERLELTSEELAREIIRDVNAFSLGMPQNDDITLLVVKRDRQAGEPAV